MVARAIPIKRLGVQVRVLPLAPPPCYSLGAKTVPKKSSLPIDHRGESVHLEMLMEKVAFLTMRVAALERQVGRLVERQWEGQPSAQG